MRIITIIQTTDLESFDSVPDLLIAQSQLQTVDTGYQDRGLPTPEWVTDKLQAVSREITARLEADIKRQLRADEARLTALATRAEQRKSLQDRIQRANDMLGKL